MTDLSRTIAPKSDQMNADDLIAGPITIRVTKVSLCQEPEQPIAINYDGDNSKPYKPCKSMRRVLVNLWGPDGNTYPGRSLTLFRDASVQFGGLAVGGIRISHASDITAPVTMALTATRANRKPFTVRPLVVAPDPAPALQPQRTDDDERERWLESLGAALGTARDHGAVEAIVSHRRVQMALSRAQNGYRDRLNKMISDALDRTRPVSPDDGGEWDREAEPSYDNAPENMPA